MAVNYLDISNLIPLNFVDVNRTQPANYHFYHAAKWLSNEQIKPFNVAPCYKAKWQTDDIIFLQVKSNYDPIRLTLVDDKGIEWVNLLFSIVATVGGAIYLEAALALNSVPEGYYKVYLYAGNPVQVTLESEWLDIRVSHERTLLYKYNNNENDITLLWETGISFLFRCEGTIAEYLPKANRVVFTDQPSNAKTVKGVSWDLYKLCVGNEDGVPDYVPRIITDILNQSYIEADGVQISAVTDAEMTPNREPGYEWAGWQVDILMAQNRGAKRFESNGIQLRQVAEDFIVEGKLFGPIVGPANSNDYLIEQIQ